MAGKNVEYQISLKDLLSGKVREAEGHVNHFEHTLEHTRDLTKEMVGAAVGFFGLYQGIEFIKSSVEAYNNVEKSLSQLRAGLESTKGAAGVTYEELTEGAEKFAGSTIYNKETILDMQAQLLSFPEITKQVFEQAEQAVMDLATRTGHSAHDVSIMVGKALGDPTKGVTALRRVGVEFNATQTEMIKKLASTGHLVQAQQMILKELNREYAGSTAAASATAGGQLEILKHQFDEVKESVGKLVMEEVIHLAPAIKEGIKDFREFTEWVDKNKEGIISVGKAVGEVVLVMYAWEKTTAIIGTAVGAWEALKGTIEGVKAAITGVAAAEEVAAAIPIAKGVAGGAAGAATSGLVDKYGAPIASAAVTGEVAAGAIGAEAAGGEVAAAGIGTAGLASIVVPLLAAAAVVYAVKTLAEHIGVINKPVDGDPDKQHEINIAEADEAENRRKGMLPIGYEDKTDYSKLNYGGGDISKAVSEDAANTKKIVDLNKKNEVEALKHKDKKTDAILSQNQLSVQGQTVKNIYVIINGGLAKVTVNAATVTESKEDIKRIVDDALTAALNDAEINN